MQLIKSLKMKKIIRLFESICVVGALVGCSSVGSEQDLHVINELRAPDYPLVTIDWDTSLAVHSWRIRPVMVFIFPKTVSGSPPYHVM